MFKTKVKKKIFFTLICINLHKLSEFYKKSVHVVLVQLNLLLSNLSFNEAHLNNYLVFKSDYMAPNIEPTGILYEQDVVPERKCAKRTKVAKKYELLWFNIIYLSLAHIGGFYGLYLLFSVKWQTLIFSEL